MTIDATKLTGLARQEAYEHLLVGCALLGGDAVKANVAHVQPHEFSDAACGAFWRWWLGGETAEAAALKAKCYQDALGWVADVTSYLDAPTFARMMREQGQLNQVVQPALPRLAQAVAAGNFEQAAEIGRTLAGLNAQVVKPLATTAEQIEAMVQRLYTADALLPTMLAPLDNALGGLDAATLTLWAARPSMGKTTSVFQAARGIAASGRKVLFFSLEMSAEQLWRKAAAGAHGIAVADIRARRINDNQRALIAQTAGELSANLSNRLRIVDDAQLTTETAWRISAMEKPDVVLVDHLILLRDAPPANGNEHQRIGGISKRLKALAKAQNIPVIACQQLSRDVARRGDKEPQLVDLRESGSLEEDADIVIMLHRPDYYVDNNMPKPPFVPLLFFVRKFREGAVGAPLRMWFDLPHQWLYTKEEMVALGQERYVR